MSFIDFPPILKRFEYEIFIDIEILPDKHLLLPIIISIFTLEVDFYSFATWLNCRFEMFVGLKKAWQKLPRLFREEARQCIALYFWDFQSLDQCFTSVDL
jgi:hypothetical protein